MINWVGFGAVGTCAGNQWTCEQEYH